MTFAPGGAGPQSGNLFLDSNDPEMPQVLVPLQGLAEPAPVLSVTPPALDVILSEGGQSVGSLQLSNDGGSPLEFSIHRQLLPPVFTDGDPDDPTLSAVERTFRLLSPSPEPLSCIVEDDVRGHLYGQAHQGDAFYRYLAVDDAWERLATAPLNASGGCGAALLHDTLYTAYGFDSSALGAYDIEAGRWSMVDNPFILPSANITSDGERFLYLVSGSQLLRIDPISGENTILSRPPFAFTRLGIRYREHFGKLHTSVYKKPMLTRVNGRAAVVVDLEVETSGGHDAIPASKRGEASAGEAVARELKARLIDKLRTHPVAAGFAESPSGSTTGVERIRAGR